LPEVPSDEDPIALPAARAQAVSPNLEAIAELALASANAFECFIAYRTQGADGFVRSAGRAGPEWDAAARAMLASLAGRGDLPAWPAPARSAGSARQPRLRASISVAGAEVGALCGGMVLPAEDVRAVVCAGEHESAEVRVLIFAPAGGRSASGLEALSELVCRAALSATAAEENEALRGFWRKRATEGAEKYAGARLEMDAGERGRHAIDALLARARSLPLRERYVILGETLAASGPFDGWLLAAVSDGELGIVATAPRMAALPPLDGRSALRKCFAEQVTLSQGGTGAASGGTHEDRVLGRPYLCVPFESGAIALASRTPAGEALRARVEATVRRLGPLMRSWTLETELARERALVRRLALRMFAAVDEERARIARDLHDDQAQLLAAARIALEGGRDEARGIFKRLEAELRRRVRELRPATLGQATLAEALRAELQRLAAAGIKTRLSMPAAAAQLSPTAQKLCYRVAREALSNVLRHSGATRARIAVESRSAVARISVTDDGHGFAPGAHERGTGLAGLRERLELMGATLTIQSRPGETRLVAEIPEPV
jgi:anti-sigma regulatory factor (Ser/Thr protein kinase)